MTEITTISPAIANRKQFDPYLEELSKSIQHGIAAVTNQPLLTNLRDILVRGHRALRELKTSHRRAIWASQTYKQGRPARYTALIQESAKVREQLVKHVEHVRHEWHCKTMSGN